MVSFNSFLSTNKESCLNGTWASKEITSPSVKRNFIEKKIGLFFLVDYKQFFDDFRKKNSACCPKGVQKFPIIFRQLPKKDQGWRSGESLSHSTNLARVQISPSTPSVGEGCFWLSPCSDRFFSGFSGFPLNLQTNTFKFQLDLKRASTFNPLFYTGATRKTVFQFLFSRISRKLLVNGKQPKDSPVPDPEVGGGVRPSGPSPGSANVHFRFRIQYLWTRDKKKPFILRIHASACAPQNVSGTATFQNRDVIKAEKSALLKAWT